MEFGSGAERDLADWDRIAPGYLDRAASPDGRIFLQFTEAVWKVIGDVRRQRVLDLGCGPGWMSRALRDAGARVRGIDGSSEMLRQAKNVCPEVEFLQRDLSRGLPYPKRSFDLVVSHMLVTAIPTVLDLFRSVRRCLARRGRFVFSLRHPCFYNFAMSREEASGRAFRKVTGYLEPEVWRVSVFEGGHNHYHRSLTDYFEALRASGLAVTRFVEPKTDPGADEPDSGLRSFRASIPDFLVIEARPL
ncbi:MAG: class I SAM-dependent methyltransferase [Thermoanaerobaculia bacterium]